ncbi:MAG: von Willebrand factor type A domain-containing protein, partial [bacterium]
MQKIIYTLIVALWIAILLSCGGTQKPVQIDKSPEAGRKEAPKKDSKNEQGKKINSGQSPVLKVSEDAACIEAEAVSSIRMLAKSGAAGILTTVATDMDRPRVIHNTEEYNKINDNIFLSPRTNPLSTFSIDVDAASYANVRRFLNSGQLPYKDAVRIEELVNYFNYDYPDPQSDHPFSVTTEVSQAPWNQAHKLIHIGLQGKKLNYEDIKPSNLVFLVDVSGSMNSPNKLPLLKSAFKLLVKNLQETDKIAIVAYAGAAGLVLPSTPAKEQTA